MVPGLKDVKLIPCWRPQQSGPAFQNAAQSDAPSSKHVERIMRTGEPTMYSKFIIIDINVNRSGRGSHVVEGRASGRWLGDRLPRANITNNTALLYLCAY